MFRPRPTTWFELLTSRGQFARTMQTLAAHGVAQLEASPYEGSEPVLPRLDGFFAAFRELEAQYGAYWPDARGHAGAMLENPIEVLEETLEKLSGWAERADPVVSDLRACEARLGELELIGKLVEAVPAGTPLHHLTETQARLLEHAIYFLQGPEVELPEIEDVLFDVFPSRDGAFVIALAGQPEMAEVATRMAALRATPVPLPDFLSTDHTAHARQVRKEIEEAWASCRRNRARLDALAEEIDLAGLLNRVAVLEWLQANSGEVGATRHMVRITGWTRSPDGVEIRRALDEAGIDYAVTLGDPTRENPPMVLDNPHWLRPFEFFPRLLGVPANRDVDPSVLTAVVAPLLFGFMFGDVGQGAVLLVAGLVLSRRMPMLFLLVPGGVMAMVFGLMFGSVFSLEHVIPALWLHPLDEPIRVLAAALVLGAVLLLVGVVLDFTQAFWHRRTARWLGESGGVVLAFIGLLGAWFEPALALALPVGLGLTVVAAGGDGGWTPAAAAKAAAEFVEALMRLLVAAVSFSRVGAFALAHAGLSAAIVGVADAIGGVGFWLALLVGNLLILALEGLVTGIQTTRLILFEFFIRFFRAEGREFRPLSAPRSHFSGENTP